MTPNLFAGQLVRLAAQNPETDAEFYARWSHDSDYLRVLDTDPARPRARAGVKHDLEKDLERQDRYAFAVRTLADDRLIGFVALWVWNWPSVNGGVGIGMGDPEYRGRGYGTDAMRLAVRYAFNELGLDYVTLQAVAHNARAIRSYEKVGFELMGTEREWDLRDGARNGVVTMAISRHRWDNALGHTLLPYLHSLNTSAASGRVGETP
jgi:RimJ/RimL family protein N-acetyltransferase